MAGHIHQRHFTLEDARRELTSLHALASKLVELKAALDRKGWDTSRHMYFGGMGPNGDGDYPFELETMVDILRGLDDRGVIVKGLDEGLFDFPHIRLNGEEVYLCWKLGEDDIAYWHPVADGFAGRRSIEEL